MPEMGLAKFSPENIFFILVKGLFFIKFWV
jgi:hypothetical protein